MEGPDGPEFTPRLDSTMETIVGSFQQQLDDMRTLPPTPNKDEVTAAMMR
jgi:hypothetical protein